MRASAYTENEQMCAGRGRVWSPSSHLSDVSMSLTNSTNLRQLSYKNHRGLWAWRHANFPYFDPELLLRHTVGGQQITGHFGWPDTILSALWFTDTLLYFKESCKDEAWHVLYHPRSLLRALFLLFKSRAHCKFVILTNTTTATNQLEITTWQRLH